MLNKKIKDYYIHGDLNCAETLVRALSDVYNLDIGPEEMKLLSGFGLGMGCKRTCGVLCGGIAALGKLTVSDRAHATEGFSEVCEALVLAFEKSLGSDQCGALREKYRTDAERCLPTILKGAHLIEDFLTSHGIHPKL
ncbi:MAG TPA: C-GCAxxG-C-C family (seleno)protein [Clostridia bacterium]|jgi:C_GCAxxG_C_C family probable redox protein|nr:C-GCAxxG-C-C family (seleno)protein [Clostridia bacterium]HPY42743.1 C-GCAxxG-C-C family (seleno)protein [Clostridia bacterium]HQA96569.1 C-GCAxxG-C-C family (seleno)protein [Clostridia bacterium]HQO54716.1 C-GCAxxG-C-C family (seleno)protein [Clostridia bacterium]HUM60076.1 C-GCAxxG-C-C family (seleno)protein [Clostridia bacterium]